jgi:hypothetical protein
MVSDQPVNEVVFLFGRRHKSPSPIRVEDLHYFVLAPERPGTVAGAA